MKKEYRINFDMPKNYEARDVLMKLPLPISSEMTEIYNYAGKAILLHPSSCAR